MARAKINDGLTNSRRHYLRNYAECSRKNKEWYQAHRAERREYDRLRRFGALFGIMLHRWATRGNAERDCLQFVKGE